MLSSLPNELLLKIYAVFDDIETASKLARTNKRLHALWTSDADAIIGTCLRRQLTAYDEALNVAIAEVHHDSIPPTDSQISLKRLTPVLLRNADMCQRVCTQYHDVWSKQVWHDRVWDLAYTSTMFYDTVLLAFAHDWPQLRRAARRRIKRLSRSQIFDQSAFAQWFISESSDPEVQSWCGFLKPHPGKGSPDYDDYFDNPYTDRWTFALCTISVYDSKLHEPEIAFGPDGHWSNWRETDYRPDWE